MWQKIQNLFSAPSLAVARNVLMAVSGVLCALGFLSATQAQAIIDKIMAVGTAFGVLVGAVIAGALVSPAHAQGTSSERAACISDAFRLCLAQAITANARGVASCLIAHKQQLSPTCRAVFAAHHAF